MCAFVSSAEKAEDPEHGSWTDTFLPGSAAAPGESRQHHTTSTPAALGGFCSEIYGSTVPSGDRQVATESSDAPVSVTDKNEKCQQRQTLIHQLKPLEANNAPDIDKRSQTPNSDTNVDILDIDEHRQTPDSDTNVDIVGIGKHSQTPDSDTNVDILDIDKHRQTPDSDANVDVGMDKHRQTPDSDANVDVGMDKHRQTPDSDENVDVVNIDKCTSSLTQVVTESGVNEGEAFDSEGLRTRDNHQQSKTYISKNVCETCNKTFKTSKYLNRHVANVHKRTRSHICNICNKAFKHKGTLKVHMMIHTEKLKSGKLIISRSQNLIFCFQAGYIYQAPCDYS